MLEGAYQTLNARLKKIDEMNAILNEKFDIGEGILHEGVLN
jgi:hypothetical protein